MSPSAEAAPAAGPAAGRDRRRTIAGIGVGVVFSVIALAVVVGSFDVPAALAGVSRAEPALLLLALPVIALQASLRAVRWRLLLPPGPDGLRPPFRAVVPAMLAGYLGNAVLPFRLGEVVRSMAVARIARLDAPASLGAAALERILDVPTLAIVALGAAVFVAAPAWVVGASAIAAIGGGLIVLWLAGPGWRHVRPWLERAAVRWPPLERPIDAVLRVLHGTDASGRRRILAAAAGLSLIAWLLDGTLFWLVGTAVGAAPAYPVAMLISAMTVLSTVVPSAPGYVGTFDLAAATTAAALGVPATLALTLALVAHAVTVLPIALAGAVSVVFIARRRG